MCTDLNKSRPVGTNPVKSEERNTSVRSISHFWKDPPSLALKSEQKDLHRHKQQLNSAQASWFPGRRGKIQRLFNLSGILLGA